VLAGLAGLALAACQPLPRPLADLARPGPDLLLLPDRGGVVVLEIAGMPDGHAGALAQAVVEALHKLEIPASTGPGNRESLFLTGQIGAGPAIGDRVEAEIEWDLVDGDGRMVGHAEYRQAISRAALAGGEPAQVRALAARAAEPIKAMLERDKPTAAVANEPAIRIAGVTGAPGDGNRSLPRALAAGLRRAGLTVTDDATKAAAVIAGTVTVAPAADTKQAVAIHWLVSRPDGSEVGVIDQANEIAKGSLDGPWADIAHAVAEAAAEGIAALIGRMRATLRAPDAPAAAPPGAGASPGGPRIVGPLPAGGRDPHRARRAPRPAGAPALPPNKPAAPS